MDNEALQIRRVLNRRYCMDSEVMNELARSAERRRLKKGDILIAEGAPLDTLYILISGGLKQVRYTEDGKEIVLTLLMSPGDPVLCSAFDIYSSNPSHTTVIATRGSLAVSLPCSVLREKMEQSAELTRCCVDGLNEYLHWYSSFHFALSQYRSDLKGLYRYELENDPYLAANAVLEDMASFLGVSYYHLSRVRTELRRTEPELFDRLSQYKT